MEYSISSVLRTGIVRIAPIAMVFWCFGSTVFSEDNLDDAAISRLVASLVSPNEEPVGMNPGLAYSPKNYDDQAQHLIVDSLKQLTRAGERAFSQLTDHIDDKQYCVTELTGTGYYNRDVGTMCRRIIQSHVDGAIVKVAGRDYKYLSSLEDRGLVGSKTQWQKWWSANKDRGLAQIQLDAIDWALRSEEDVSRLNTLKLAQERLRETRQALPPDEARVTDEIEESPVEREVPSATPPPKSLPQGADRTDNALAMGRLQALVNDANDLVRKAENGVRLNQAEIEALRERVKSLSTLCNRIHALGKAALTGGSLREQGHSGFELAKAMAELNIALGDKQSALKNLRCAVTFADEWVEFMHAVFDAGDTAGANALNELCAAINAKCSTQLELIRLEDSLKK